MHYDIFFILFLHYLGDFPMQGTYLAMNKGKDDYLLFSHSMIWAGLISVGLLYFGLFEMWKAMFLLIGHFCIDRWKARKVNSTHSDLIIDQALHMIQLLAVYLL